MSEMCKFTTGDLVRHVDGWSPHSTRLYIIIRAHVPIPQGPIQMECWDPMIRGYTRFWDYDLRLVSPWSERVIDEPG